MDAAFAEHFANGAGKLDAYARIILDCLLKRGDFASLADVVGVEATAVGDREFAVDVEVSHVKLRGIFRHAFAKEQGGLLLCGVLDFRAVDEGGCPHGDVVLRIIHDEHGNCGWRGDPGFLHTSVPIGVPEAQGFRRYVLQLLRLKVFELLEAAPLEAL